MACWYSAATHGNKGYIYMCKCFTVVVWLHIHQYFSYIDGIEQVEPFPAIITPTDWRRHGQTSPYHNTVDGFIFVGTNFRGSCQNYTFVGVKICSHSIYLHNSYQKSLFDGYYISWIWPSTKTGTPRKLRHPQYIPSEDRRIKMATQWNGSLY